MSKQNYRVLWYTYNKYTYEGGNTMALIKCAECGKEFSDKAQACPNCGCPTSEAKNQELKQEEIKEDPEFELQLENDYSLKIVSDTVKLFYQNGFILESDVRGFVLNWLSEEEELGRNQLNVVFSHPGYKKPMKLSVSNTSERYEKAKYFAENVAEKYFKKDICPGYFEAIHYAEQHVDNVLFRKSYENEQKIIKEKKQIVQNQANNQQISSRPLNNSTPVQNVQIQSTPKKKKKGHCGTVLWVIIILAVLGSVFGKDSKKEDKNSVSDINENVIEETVTPEVTRPTLTYEEELSVFSSGEYMFISNSDLDKYCTNMDGVKVYVVTDIDDIKDGIIQSNLSDGFMMSSFNVGERFPKYESGLLEGDIIAICGIVSGQDNYGFVGNSVNLNDCYVFASGQEAEKYRKDKSDDALSQYFVVTEEVADSNEVSEEDYKSLCQQLDYTDILRNPDSYDGKYCVVSGTVDQVIEGWFGSYTIFVMDGNGNKWGCTYSYDDGETHILEGDNVVAYGKCNGVANTETVLGEQVTLPHISIEYWG